MNLEALIHRVMTRFAARSVNVPPFKMEPCRHCDGDGVHTEKTLQVKNLCVRCFGTGTDPKSMEALNAEVQSLTEQYQLEYHKFQKAKKQWGPGRSHRPFGTQQGFDLQTLRITMTTRQEQLQQELARLDMGKQLARVAGAAAR
jgi:hypothetical protein